jgi:hypothetical protein
MAYKGDKTAILSFIVSSTGTRPASEVHVRKLLSGVEVQQRACANVALHNCISFVGCWPLVFFYNRGEVVFWLPYTYDMISLFKGFAYV